MLPRPGQLLTSVHLCSKGDWWKIAQLRRTCPHPLQLGSSGKGDGASKLPVRLFQPNLLPTNSTLNLPNKSPALGYFGLLKGQGQPSCMEHENKRTYQDTSGAACFVPWFNTVKG